MKKQCIELFWIKKIVENLSKQKELKAHNIVLTIFKKKLLTRI
jgi:hypothetical protein